MRRIDIALCENGDKSIEEVRDGKLEIYTETQCTLVDAIKEAKACYYKAQEKGDIISVYNGDMYEWTGKNWRKYQAN